MSATTERRLSAIMPADLAGYEPFYDGLRKAGIPE